MGLNEVARPRRGRAERVVNERGAAMKRLALCVWVLMSLALPSSGGAETAPDVIQYRGGLPNFCRSLVDSASATNGERRRRVVYYGNDFLYDPQTHTPSPLMPVPAGAKDKKQSFCSLLNSFYSHELAPKSIVFRANATTPAPSWYGAFRIYNRGILVAFGDYPLKLVVLDFANNDRTLPVPTVHAGMEGMVRQIRTKFPGTDILILYTPSKAFVWDYREGRMPESIALQEKIADHYRIPSINLAKRVAEKIIAGELKEEDVFLDDLVVSDAGDQLCFEAVKPLFMKSLATAKQSPAPETYTLPEPLGAYPIDAPSTVSYETATLEPGWLGWQRSPIESCLHVLQCEAPGPVLTLRFKGSVVGLSCVVGPDSGDLEYAIDGSSWKLKRCVTGQAGGAFKEVPVLLGAGLDPAGEHVLKLRVAPETPAGSTGKVIRLASFFVNGAVIYDDPYKGMSTLQRIDAIYADMEPVKYKAPADRWEHLPVTLKKLGEGPALNMVMLGDSIVNDTSYSSFELLIGRRYPKCKINKIVSVRGSTGCDWYKGEGRVQEYVLKYQPDLLMIGGISNRGVKENEDTESIRDVIRQVRASKPDTEILLMTGAFGWRQDPKLNKEWQEVVSPDGKDYRSRLMKLAEEEKAAFLDLHGAWGRYVLDSKWTCGSFMRDGIHANDRGKQILGRILEAYFAPKQ
jgi:lysophospholipase L1-like esterase